MVLGDLKMNKTIIYESEIVNQGDVFDFDNMDFQVEVTLSHVNEVNRVRLVTDITDVYKGNNAFKREVDLSINK